MFTFQTTSKFYQKKNSQKDGLVGSITLTHFIENLPEWNIELEDEFAKRRDGSESGKCAYTFHDYLLDCLEDDILTDLQAVGKFCKEMEYVFETSYDFRNLYLAYMDMIDQNLAVQHQAEEDKDRWHNTHLDLVKIKGVKCYQLMLKEICEHN